MNLINENDFKEVSKCLNDIVKKVVKKENNRLYAIKYRKNNKEKIKENDRKRSKKRCKKKRKEYYENNKEEIKEKRKQYYENNKQIILEKNKDYYENNKKEIIKINKIYYKKNKKVIIEQKKEYYENNKEKILKYRKSENCKKSVKISCWKGLGLISDDYDLIYDKYLNTSKCDNCNCILTIDRFTTSTTKCMDHDHNSGLFRNILCNACNVKRK